MERGKFETTIVLEDERTGTYDLFIGYEDKPIKIREHDLIDLKRAVDLAIEKNGLMVGCHTWNGLITVDDRIQGWYGCSAQCLTPHAENLYKRGKDKIKTVSVWECIKTYGVEDEVQYLDDVEDEDEIRDEPEPEKKTVSLDDFMIGSKKSDIDTSGEVE